MLKAAIVSLNSNPSDLVESFLDSLDGLATQNKVRRKLIVLENQTSRNNKMLLQFFPAKKGKVVFEEKCIENDEIGATMHFLQSQGNQFPLQDRLERNAKCFLFVDAIVHSRTST